MRSLQKKLLFTCAAVLGWIIVFKLLGKFYGTTTSWGLMLIGAAIITFFSILALPGGVEMEGTIKESRIRFAIAGSLVILYLVYFGSVVYLEYEVNHTEEKTVSSFAVGFLRTLSNVLMVTVSFYFGSTAAIDIAGRFTKKNQ